MLLPHAISDSILIALSGLVGFFGLSSAPRFATFILAVPVLWGLASNRKSVFAVMLAYFLTVSRGLLPGAAVFLSEHHNFFQAAALYLLMSLGVSLPFLIWSKNKRKKALCLPVAFLVSFVLPPISLIGIVNPLMATGTIFKGFGFTGMAFILLLWSLCAVSRRVARLSLCLLFGFAMFSSASWYETTEPEGFLAIDTSFGRLGSGSYHFEQDYERMQLVLTDLRQRELEHSDARYFVLPETIAGRLNTTGIDLWREEMGKVLPEDAIVIFGGEIPTGDGRKYDNTIIMLHDGQMTIIPQRIPVPYSMYRGAFAQTGANLHLFEDGILQLPDGRVAAVVICYEAFLTWPYLMSMRHKADLILTMANLWWCRDTSLPATQRTTVRLWGLLFGVPVLFVQNI